MSSNTFKEDKLFEICNFCTGKLNSNAATLNGKYPFFTCSPQTLQIDEYAFEGEALLLAGNNAEGKFNIKYYNGKFNAYQRTYVITPKDFKRVDLKYVYYSLSLMLNKFRELSIGTATKFLTMGILNVFKIPLPRIEEQRAIAATLSALDDKIELNNRINKNLEEMAQALFKRWFVDFEFPDENGQPYKSAGGEMKESELGPIPKGWKVSGLGEIIETVNGFSYKGSDIKESVNAMMTIKNFNRNGGLNADGFKEIEISERVKDKHYVDLFDVVVACTDITQKADIIGNPVLVLTKAKYRKIVISMDLVKVIVKHPFISSCLVYMFLKDVRFKQQALGYTSGTTVLHLNKMVFSDYPIIIPEDEKLLEKMSFVVEPIFHLIGMTIDNSQNLTSLRDALLPKLMSGEIRVPIEEVATDV